MLYHLLFCLRYMRLSFLLPLDILTYPPFLSFLLLPLLISSPPPPGFLQITPEGSPQALRKGEVGGEANVSGSFCLHTSGLDFTTQEMSKEHQVSSEEGTVTMVTKTTRITRQRVTTETQPGESSTTRTTTHQVSDVNYWGCCNDILNVFKFFCFSLVRLQCSCKLSLQRGKPWLSKSLYFVF